MLPALRRYLAGILLACTAGAVALWVYWPTLAGLAQRWSSDPQYSHGFLVPLFAAYLLWARRKCLAENRAEPSWWAAPFLGVAALLHVGGAYLYSPWLEQISILPLLAGLCLGLWGWRTLVTAMPALAFLLFMLPLPGRLDKVLAAPLQHVATVGGTNALQTFGFFAQSEGNVILLSDYELGIVEACSGLRMLVVFLATATAVAVTMQRSLLQRVLVVLSAVPIALLCNVIRITTTGIMHETVGHEAANLVYHHAAGWLMAPLALAFLGLELLILRRLFVVVDGGGAPFLLAR
jgi:exosortase